MVEQSENKKSITLPFIIKLHFPTLFSQFLELWSTYNQLQWCLKSLMLWLVFDSEASAKARTISPGKHKNNFHSVLILV